jgi:hypothetical protein
VAGPLFFLVKLQREYSETASLPTAALAAGKSTRHIDPDFPNRQDSNGRRRVFADRKSFILFCARRFRFDQTNCHHHTLLMRVVPRTRVLLPEIILGERNEKRHVRRATPGTALKGLEKLQHSLTPPFATEQGCGGDLLGESGLHGAGLFAGIVPIVYCAAADWTPKVNMIPSTLGICTSVGNFTQLEVTSRDLPQVSGLRLKANT